MLPAIVDAVADAGLPPFVTSELALAETLVRPFREQNQEAVEGFKMLLASNQWLAVEPVSRDALWEAALLRSQHLHLKLPDAIHISTALLTGCTHLLTADLRLREHYDELRWLGDMRVGSQSVHVIRPTLDMLETIYSWLRP